MAALRPGDRAAGLLGLASASLILGGSLVAAVPYSGYEGESYSPVNHFISELGEVPTSKLGWVFNACLIAGAGGLGVFVLALSRHLSGRFRPALVSAGLVAGTAGALVGVFPMSVRALHQPVSYAFFLTGWIVVAIFSAWLVSDRRAGFPHFLLVPGGLAIATSLTFVSVYSVYRPTDPDPPILDRPAVWAVAWLEWAALLTLLAWFVCVSLVLIRQRPKSA
jgi:hypothetical membrane protein